MPDALMRVTITADAEVTKAADIPTTTDEPDADEADHPSEAE